MHNVCPPACPPEQQAGKGLDHVTGQQLKGRMGVSQMNAELWSKHTGKTYWYLSESNLIHTKGLEMGGGEGGHCSVWSNNQQMGKNCTNFNAIDPGKWEWSSNSSKSSVAPRDKLPLDHNYWNHLQTRNSYTCNYKLSWVFWKTTFSKFTISKIKEQSCNFKMILLIAFVSVMDKDMTQIISMHILVKKSSWL